MIAVRLLIVFAVLNAAHAVAAEDNSGPLKDTRRFQVSAPITFLKEMRSRAELEDAAVRFVRLSNGPNEPHAIIETLGPGRVVDAYVLEQAGGHWFQIAQFESWYKYESGDAIAQFLTVNNYHDDDNSDLVVRDSGGGTGLYQRNIVIYGLQRGRFREILRIENEQRLECPWDSSNCRVEHAEIVDWDQLGRLGKPLSGSPAHLLVIRFSARLASDKAFRPWWSTIQSRECMDFIWERGQFRFRQALGKESGSCEQFESAKR